MKKAGHLPGQGGRCPPGQVRRNGRCVAKEKAIVEVIEEVKAIFAKAEKDFGYKVNPDTLKALDGEIQKEKLTLEKNFWGNVIFKKKND